MSEESQQQKENAITSIERKIIAYIQTLCDPQAILLTGSRAVHKQHAESDWDIIIFCKSVKNILSGFYEWQGELLDMTFTTLPQSDGGVLRNAYRPLWPVKILFDETEGFLKQLLENTQEKYTLGPQKVYPGEYEKRIVKFKRLLQRIDVYSSHTEVQYYYLGHAYELFVRLWFEVRNQWPESPAEAFRIIEIEDKKYWDLLDLFRSTNLVDKVSVAKRIALHLNLSFSK